MLASNASCHELGRLITMYLNSTASARPQIRCLCLCIVADLGKEKKILDPTICFAGQECLKKLNNLQKAIWAWCFWMLFFSWCLQETRWLWADDRSHPCRASPILGCTWVPTNYQRYWQLKVRNLYADLLTLSIWTKFKDALVILIDHAILYVNNTRTNFVCQTIMQSSIIYFPSLAKEIKQTSFHLNSHLIQF